MEPEAADHGPEEEYPEIAGVIRPTLHKRRVFRPDIAAPPVDRESLKSLWARKVAAPDVRRQLIANVLNYQSWFDTMHEVVMEDIAQNHRPSEDSTGEMPKSGT